ncbi:hypothetical protein ACOYW6_04910 [Parablastomonas sp. CN1-191]|uniref:hypothetical protein n=1 Tax=Parablastomonas sp. CN1-191 TaxID=3400908 RepID=UPI003BF90F5B
MTPSPVPMRAVPQADLPATAEPWRPEVGACPFTEVFASADDAAGAALALAFAREAARAVDALSDQPDRRSWLWVQDAEALRRGGRPYLPGLPAALRERLVHVAAKKPGDALFALEEGVRCRELAFVVGEIAGNPRALDFTASRRLALAAERHGVPLWLVRLDAARDLGAARQRWQAGAAPSPPHRWNARAPGTPAWQAELFRARRHPPGEWTLDDDGSRLAQRPAHSPVTPYHGGMVRAAGDRSLAAG